MRPRTIAVLVVIGILAIAGGWYFGAAQQPTEQQAYNGGRLMFPDLASMLLDAARIESVHHGKTTTLARHGDMWGLLDRGGYPVQSSKLRGMLTGLTELRLVEQRCEMLRQAVTDRLGCGTRPRCLPVQLHPFLDQIAVQRSG